MLNGDDVGSQLRPLNIRITWLCPLARNRLRVPIGAVPADRHRTHAAGATARSTDLDVHRGADSPFQRLAPYAEAVGNLELQQIPA